MKIAMIGSGAAGSVFASYLRKGGADITLVDPYREHMEKVAKDGMTFVIYPDETYQLTGFKTALNAEGIGIMDAVIFMTKATQARDALKTAEPCIGEDTVLVSLMNGLGNEDILLTRADPRHVMYGSGVIGTALDGPGKCISSPIDGVQMNFGAVENGPATDAVGKHLEKCFNDGGCYAVFQEGVVDYDVVQSPLQELVLQGEYAFEAVLHHEVKRLVDLLRHGSGDHLGSHQGGECGRRSIHRSKLCQGTAERGIRRDHGLFPVHGTGYAHVPSADGDRCAQRCHRKAGQEVRDPVPDL